MASPLNDPKLEALLNNLHSKSNSQMDETISYFKKREKACDDLMNYLIGGSITQLHYDYLETVASDLSEHEGLKYKQWQDPSQEGRLTEEYIKKLVGPSKNNLF